MNQKIKKIGLILMGLSLVALMVTGAGMMMAFRAIPTNASASSLAEGISATLLPAAIGSPVFLIGLVLFVVGWFRGRNPRPTAIA